MSTKELPVVEVSPSVVKGDAKFEAKRQACLSELGGKIPKEYRLPLELVQSPPANVTQIPQKSGILTAEELAITEDYDAVALAAAIAGGKLTAVAALKAYAKRAAIAHQLTFCLSDYFPEAALAQAEKLDEHQSRTGKTVGPLHGLPISIKCHYPIKGHLTDFGLFASQHVSQEDCYLVKILKDLGAVIFCKTHGPQALMSLEGASALGRTLNPYNIHLTSGGSSAGEAALVAMKGSAVGFGSDIGGSIREPAAFCGLYGFKATGNFFTTANMFVGGIAAELNILACVGPLARTLRDIDLVTGAIMSQKPWLLDPSGAPIEWLGLSPSKKLKVGIMLNDGLLQPQPPMARAIRWAQTQLKEHGFEVKPYVVPHPDAIYQSIRKMYWPDGGVGVLGALEAAGEPKVLQLSEIIKDAGDNQDRSGSLIAKWRVERDDFRFSFAGDWQRQDVDVVISPSFAGPAPAHDTAVLHYFHYQAIWNYVDYPSLSFPTPIRIEKGEKYAADDHPLSEDCRYARKQWETVDFGDAPISLMATARRYHENDLMAAMAAMKNALQLP